MKLFNRPPKIKKGHSFIDYSNKYGKQYVNSKLNVESNVKNLKNNKTYWEIDGKYYEVNHSRFFKITLCSLGALSIAANVFVPIYFTVIAPKDRYHDYSFQYWNNCDSLNTLKNYVKEVTNPNNKTYIPQIDRIATFDMDGTLFGERSQIYIEWMYFNDYLDRNEERKEQFIQYSEKLKGETTLTTHNLYMKDVYKNIKTFMDKRVSPSESTDSDGKTYEINLEFREAYAGAKLFSGLTINEYITDFNTFLEKDAYSFNNIKFKDMFYKPMIEVVEFLQVNNFDVYIVSGTDRFMVRDIVNQHLKISYNKVIGMDVELKPSESKSGELERTDKLLVKNVEKEKVKLIAQEIGKKPVLSFGNSGGDVAMHNFALSNENYKSQAFMVVADDCDREFGYQGEELEKRIKGWTNFNKFSMKNDFKTIYGDNVTKKSE